MFARTTLVLSLVLLSVAAAAQAIFPSSGFPVYQPPAGCGSGCDYLAIQTLSGDFNHDGHLDFAYVAEPSYLGTAPDYLVIVLGQGSAAPQQIATAITGCTVSNGLAVADVNQDHNLDVVLLCAEGFAETLLGNGDGTFQAPILSSMPADAFMLTLADFNGDHFPDVAFAIPGQTYGSVAPSYAIALNQKNGSFAAPITYPLKAGPLAIAAGDFNGDGKQDLAFNNGYVLGNGDGTFSTELSLPSNIAQIAVADFNHDGYADLAYALVAGSPGASSLYLLNGSSSGLSAQPAPLPSSSLPITSLQPLPLAGSQTDLLAFLQEGGAAIFTPDGNGSFPPPIPWANSAYAVADLHLDGLPDLVGYDGANQTFFVASGVSNAGVFQGIPLTLASNGPFVLADMNGDGLPDIVNKRSGPPQVLLSTGNGRFVAVPAPATSVSDTGSFLVAADFNGDSHPDVASISSFVLCSMCGASPGPAQIFSYIGDGDGTLTFLKAVNLPFQTTTGAVAGDFNGDGKQDLIVTYSDQGGGAVFIPGNGDGTFGTATPISLLGHAPAAIVAADLNGDGILDLVIADSSGTVISYLGKGDGSFTGLSQTLSATAVSMTVADVTGDGVPDLVYITSQALLVNAGNGNGTFSASPVFSLPVAPTEEYRQVATGDLNGDGLPDIAVSCFDYDYGHIAVFLNQGAGNFTADAHLYAAVPGASSAFFLTRLNSRSSASGTKQYLDACVAHPSTISATQSDLVGLLNQNNPAPALFASPTTTSLSASVTTAAQGVPLKLTATVSPATATGTVIFLDGGTSLGTSALDSGTSTFSTSSFAVGSHSITAWYSGTAANAASVSSALSVAITAPTLQLSASPASVSIAQASSGSATLTLAPVGAYSGTVSLACSGLPAYATCSFSPASLTFAASSQATQKVTITIATNISGQAQLHTTDPGGGALFACFPILPLVLLAALRRRRLPGVAIVLVLSASSLVLWGCGGDKTQAATGPVTPIGAATVTITATGANASTTLTVNITQ